MISLYPTILTSDLVLAQQQLDLSASHPDIKTVQIDIIDGQFADELTLMPLDLAELDFHGLECDVHLQVEEPMDYVWELESIKDQLAIRSVIAQVERMSFQTDFVAEVKKQNWRAGLCLDIYTPLSGIDEPMWYELDCVQYMAIEAGAQGTQFKEQVYEKIAQQKIKQNSLNQPIEIMVDGGIQPPQAKRLIQLGVEGLAVGSFLWKSPNFSEAVDQLLNSAHSTD